MLVAGEFGFSFCVFELLIVVMDTTVENAFVVQIFGDGLVE